MRYASTLFLGLLLTLSLALYSSVGLAMVGNSAAFSMEICADGVAKTVSFDANGNPVEQTQTCAECLTCCQAIGGLAPAIWSLSGASSPLDMEVIRPAAPNPIVNKRNLYPAPRGPPAVPFSIPKLIPFDQTFGYQMMRSDGRPIRKDATA